MIPYRNSHEVARRTLAALHSLTGKLESHRYLSAPNIGDEVKNLCNGNTTLERPPFGEQVHLSLSRYISEDNMEEGLVIYFDGVHHHPDSPRDRGRESTRFYRTNPHKVANVVEEIGNLDELFEKQGSRVKNSDVD